MTRRTCSHVCLGRFLKSGDTGQTSGQTGVSSLASQSLEPLEG